MIFENVNNSLMEGWVSVGDSKMIEDNEQGVDSIKNANFSQAVKKANELIKELVKSRDVPVIESYLTVKGDSSFQLMLLVHEHVFHNPEIISARITANRLAQSDQFDMRVSFSVQKEHLNKLNLFPEDYLFKYIQTAA
jgi:hypothetical protein